MLPLDAHKWRIESLERRVRFQDKEMNAPEYLKSEE